MVSVAKQLDLPDLTPMSCGENETFFAGTSCCFVVRAIEILDRF
jgi:hypothetical protein